MGILCLFEQCALVIRYDLVTLMNEFFERESTNFIVAKTVGSHFNTEQKTSSFFLRDLLISLLLSS